MNIGRLDGKSSIRGVSNARRSCATCMPAGGRTSNFFRISPYEKNGSTFHDITPCELRRRESSIAYSGVLRRMTDSSYLIRRPRIVRRTIQLFRAFIFKREREREGERRDRSTRAENMALSVDRREPEDSNRGGISFSTSRQNDGGGEPRN